MRGGTNNMRGMTNDRGLRGDRVQRSKPHENDPDVETEVIEEMEGSGRAHVFPRGGGQHGERHLPLADEVARPAPDTTGADAAPTRTAELRERERHARQRALGYVPASAEGRLRQARGPEATREALDRAAAEADAWIEQRGGAAEGTPRAAEESRGWLRRHRGLVAGACLGALGVALALWSRPSSLR
jgi:hypothetical protein